MSLVNVILPLLLLAFAVGDNAWKDFSDWFRRDGVPGAPKEVMASYAGKLRADGLSEAEAQARVQEVERYAREHPRDQLTLHFDRIYTWKEAPFRREPSALVMRAAESRKPGRALDIAMGQGRNALWLAKAGWSVSGYDISAEALRQANDAANAAGVKLDTKLASHEEYMLGESQWDLIVMSFEFTRISDAEYMKRIYDSLRPGGVLLVEGFGGGPQLEKNLILETFLDYRILLFDELPDIADWGKMKAPLLRMVLQKPEV